jgi:phage terminase large subunit-like protein
MSAATTMRPRRATSRQVEVVDYVERANEYARDVVAGLIPACRYVRQACERHIAGMERQHRAAYPYRLDADAARRVCTFIELLPHVKGKWARDRERLRLEPWQCFIVVNVYGWLRKRDGLRRYRRVYIEVPRKNAKSTLTAALALYHLTLDAEHGAEVYIGATTEKQAWEVFGPARLMAKGTPELCEAFDVTVGARNIHILPTASKCEPIIGKPGDGASPSFSVTDEYHEHATSEQYDTMVTGMGAREHPIAWVITTAGYDTSGPCHALRGEAADALEGTVEADELFALIYTIDEGVDWSSPEALRMANPNIGVSVFEEFLLTEQKRTISNPREQAKFKTKHLNVWVTAASPYFNAELWSRLGDPGLTLDQFAGETCYIGVDLAQQIDMTAAVLLFRREIEGESHFYAFSRFYLPRARVDDPATRHYAGWAEQGYLTVAGLERTDHDYIEADIIEAGAVHPIGEVAFDPYNAGSVITHIQAAIGDDKVVAVPQTVAHLSAPMKEVQALIADGKLHHDGNPCFAWQIGNVTAQEDRNQNVFPRKERRENKIDGAIALILAVAAATRGAAPVQHSIYEERGVIVL